MTILLIITILLFVAYAALLVYYRRAWQANDEYRMTNDEYRMTNDEYRDTDGADYTNYTDGGNDEVRMKNDEFADAPIQHSSFNIQHSAFVIPLTVIIPARNEEANIGRCLQSIVDQSYPAHLRQIIVADDFSTDNTAAIVQSFQGHNVSLLRLADHVTDRLNSYKKKAIELAVTQASGTLIISTDADCTVPPGWLATYATFYQQYKPAFIAAPVAILPSHVGEGSGVRLQPIEIFQALDFMTLQGITGASVYKKIHTMCNGANMAYERSAFYEVGGFTGIDHIASGDDMLLMHKIYQRYPDRVLFLKSKNAIVQTEPVHTIKEFLNQRIRWASKADKYEDKRIFWVLVLVYLFNLLILVLPIVICLMSYGLRVTGSQFPIHNSTFGITPIQVWLLLLCSKTIIELYFLYPIAQFFNNTKLLWWFPIAQPFHILYTVIAGWLGKFGSYHWKGRKVR